MFDPLEQPVDQLRAFLFQPADNTTQLIGQQLGIAANGLTFSGQPSELVVFGASGALRHTLSGDYSAITFAVQNELLNHWVIALRLTLNRDWTWDGLQDRSFDITRDSQSVGALEIRRTVGASAAAASANSEAQRASTKLIFFDAVEPQRPQDKFPLALAPTWTVT